MSRPADDGGRGGERFSCSPLLFRRHLRRYLRYRLSFVAGCSTVRGIGAIPSPSILAARMSTQAVLNEDRSAVRIVRGAAMLLTCAQTGQSSPCVPARPSGGPPGFRSSSPPGQSGCKDLGGSVLHLQFRSEGRAKLAVCDNAEPLTDRRLGFPVDCEWSTFHSALADRERTIGIHVNGQQGGAGLFRS